MIFNPHKLGVHKLLQRLPLTLTSSIRRLLNARHVSLVKRAVNIADLRNIAQQRAHGMIFDYLDGGADDEITLRRNKDAFMELELHYRVLTERGTNKNNASLVDLSTTLFGRHVEMPFFGCPTAGHEMFHTEGEAAAARAAIKHGSVYALSSLSTTSLPDIATAMARETNELSIQQQHDHNSTVTTAAVPKVFQLYVWKDRELVRDILSEVKQHDYDALALTVDVSWMGHRERDLRNGFSIPPNYTLKQTVGAIMRPAWTFDFISKKPYSYALINPDVPAESLVSFINRQLTPDFSWADAEWLLGEWHSGGNTDNESRQRYAAIKGVVRPEDAQRAINTGFDTIWISNHGGRQLDGSPAPISVLPHIKQATNDKNVTIILDGGIQRGTDICKALALGAHGVGVGKPYLWGLAAGGHAGVVKAYDILRQELERAMGLLGVGSIEELRQQGPDLVQQRMPSARDYPDRLEHDRGYGGGIV